MARPCRINPWQIVVALVLGLATTVLISWTAMFWPNGKHGYGPPVLTAVGLSMTSDGHKIWRISEGRNAWHHVVDYWFNQISGMAMMIPIADYEAQKVDIESLPRHLRPDSLDELTMQAWYREVGWPMKALTCSIHWKTQVRNADIIYTVQGGVQLPRDKEFQPRALPLTPLWSGLTVNTLCFAGAWLLLGWGWQSARQVLRTRAGCCVHCGYSRTGLPEGSVCPECGQ